MILLKIRRENFKNTNNILQDLLFRYVSKYVLLRFKTSFVEIFYSTSLRISAPALPVSKLQAKLMSLAENNKLSRSRSRTRSRSRSKSRSRPRSKTRSKSRSSSRSVKGRRSRSVSKDPKGKRRSRSSSAGSKENFEIRKKEDSVQKKRHYRSNKDSSDSEGEGNKRKRSRSKSPRKKDISPRGKQRSVSRRRSGSRRRSISRR